MAILIEDQINSTIKSAGATFGKDVTMQANLLIQGIATFEQPPVGITVTGNAPVTFTVATLASGFSADYYTDGTDDQTVINQMYEDLDALGGGAVAFRAGTYNYSDHIYPCSNSISLGEGKATIFKNTVTLKYFYPLEISNFKILNMQFNSKGINSGSNNEQNIRVQNCTNFEIAGLFVDTYAFGIFMCSTTGGSNTECSKGWVHHNYLQGSRRNDVIGGGPLQDNAPDCKDIVIEDNHIVQDASLSSQNDYNAIDLTGVNGVSFLNNTCEGNVLLGNERDPNYRCLIQGNVVKPAKNGGTARTAIYCQDTTNTGDVQSNIIVTGNLVYGGGIWVKGTTGQHSAKISVTNNMCIQDDALTNGQVLNLTQSGVRLDYADSCLISGNICQGDGVADGGISLNNSLNNQVCDNYVIDHDTALEESGTNSGNTFHGNYIMNATTAPATVSTGATGFNNRGANPIRNHAQGNVTGATTFNRLNGNVITATLTGDVTVTLTEGLFRGDLLTLVLTQDGTGSRLATWPDNFKKAGGTLTLSTGAAAVDTISMEWDGTNWNETSRSLNLG